MIFVAFSKYYFRYFVHTYSWHYKLVELLYRSSKFFGISTAGKIFEPP